MRGWVAARAITTGRSKLLYNRQIEIKAFFCSRYDLATFGPWHLVSSLLGRSMATLRHAQGGAWRKRLLGMGYMVFSSCEDGRRFEWHSIIFEQFEIVRRVGFFEAAGRALSETLGYAGILATVPGRSRGAMSARDRIGDRPALGAELRRNPNRSAALTINANEPNARPWRP